MLQPAVQKENRKRGGKKGRSDKVAMLFNNLFFHFLLYLGCLSLISSQPLGRIAPNHIHHHNILHHRYHHHHHHHHRHHRDNPSRSDGAQYPPQHEPSLFKAKLLDQADDPQGLTIAVEKPSLPRALAAALEVVRPQALELEP